MDSADHLRYLAAEVARLLEVAARDLAAPVPTCPGWTVADLVVHVATVYLNVVVPQLRLPGGQGPAPDQAGPEPLAALQHAYATLAGEFAAHAGQDHAGDETGTASFWARRMVQETAVHRVDAELALGEPSAPIAAALATDAIDEFLTVVLPHETRQWTRQYAADLSDWGHRWLLVRAGQAQWRITMRQDGAGAAPLPAPLARGQTPAACIEGDADPLLRWMYNRGGADQVTTTGDDTMTTQLRHLLSAVMSVS